MQVFLCASLFVLLLSPPAFGKRLVLQDASSGPCNGFELHVNPQHAFQENVTHECNLSKAECQSAACDGDDFNDNSGNDGGGKEGCTRNQNGAYEWWGDVNDAVASQITHHCHTGERKCVCRR